MKIVVVCDFERDLLKRVLEVYKSFKNTPDILLVSRGRVLPRYGYDLQTESIRTYRKVTEASISGLVAAFLPTITYLAFSWIVLLKIRKQRVDLVHAHFALPQGLFGIMTSRILRVPLVVTTPGLDVNHYMRNCILKPLISFVLKNADSVIAVSKPIHEALLRYGISRSVFIPNCIDPFSVNVTDIEGFSKSILFIGTLTNRKRPLLLLQGFQRVLAQVPDAELVMVGDGPLKDAVVGKIKELGLQRNVSLRSHLSEGGLDKLREESAIFVLPSTSEGLSIALLEAMAAGQAIVASRNESHEAVLDHGKTALMFDIDDAQDLASNLARVITDKHLRTTISSGARRLCIQAYSNSYAAKQLESLYEKVYADYHTAHQ
jgi:glycosyltransferase involved in cell wall biosynthesis